MNMRVAKMSEAKTRQVHNASFKAKVALEAVRETKTLNEIGQEYGVHPVQVSHWKKALLVGCRKSFDRFECLRWLDRVFNRFDDRIEALEFDPGHLGTELPVDFGLELVAWAFPSGDFLPQGVDRRNAAIQTLAGEHGQLALGHIEPTAMLGGVVKLQLAGDPPGFVRRQRCRTGPRGYGC
jgi:transposase-like protein